MDVNNHAYLGKGTIKDDKSVYYQDKKIINADTKTFELLYTNSLNMLTKDKNNCYFDGEIDTPPTRCANKKQ